MILAVTRKAPEPDYARAAVTRNKPETDYACAALCIIAAVRFICRN